MNNITSNRTSFLAQTKTDAEPACFKLNKFPNEFEFKVNSIEDGVASKIISPQNAAKTLLKSYNKTALIEYIKLRILNNQHQIKHAHNPKASGCFFESEGAPPPAGEIISESNKYIIAEQELLKALKVIKKQDPIQKTPSSAPRHYPRQYL